ncbi:hypothetical protein P3T76_014930 [Phytophthora citrophthora]|uniref:Uncharacterized protein n=1 Tax=Phytophthora citrophthora TaxID=4793 RepID=A0AAD9G122_9STRA|nr:hypothetical protein P3T76_014930 [Phytophthora citrophthora]
MTIHVQYDQAVRANVTTICSQITYRDEFVALDEALSFINFCDGGTQDEVQLSGAKVLDVHDVFTLEDVDDLKEDAIRELLSFAKTSSPKHSNELQSPSPTTKKKKRVRSAASSSTVLQRRKKAELETLRDEVARLERYLTQLSTAGAQSYALAVTTDDGHLSEWNRHALLQYQQRQKSEQENQHLKGLLDQQWRISNQLRGILHKRNVLEGLEFLKTLKPES